MKNKFSLISLLIVLILLINILSVNGTDYIDYNNYVYNIKTCEVLSDGSLNISLEAASGYSGSGNLIIAEYDRENHLSNSAIYNISGVNISGFNYSVSDINNIVKVMIWDTINTLTPLAEPQIAKISAVSSATPTPTATVSPSASASPKTLLSANCSSMSFGGPYAGKISSPFSGAALYGNGDYCKTSYTFDEENKVYRVTLKGASSNSLSASVSIYFGNNKVGSVTFNGTKASEKSIDIKMPNALGKTEIKLILETDDGSNDTFLNTFELKLIGDIPLPPFAPTPAKTGAVYTGDYRNIFREAGYSEKQINAKIEKAWEQLFYGNDSQRIYYTVGDDMAYIYTADTNDVRSEGMSYGMMICVQLDKQDEFNRLWKWAKTYMQHTDGEYKNYFAWKCNTSGSKMDNAPAPDGEEYFVTSLLFAANRWGNGQGIYDYNRQAQIILNAMLHQKDDGQGENMFDKTYKMPVFCPIGNAATYTDPSYHLPAFYEVWAELAEKDNIFWSEAASASREYFKKATNTSTGLGPDYSEFNGTPKNDGNHGDFRFDAWRIAMNIAFDYAWWAKDTWATTHADRIQKFFDGNGVENYGNQWSLDGKELGSDHSPGLVAMNATASLAASNSRAWSFVEDFWNISPTTGTYRYYDGCLYMLGLLHCSGNFRAYMTPNTK